jgi:hypothetical protein
MSRLVDDWLGIMFLGCQTIHPTLRGTTSWTLFVI